MSERPQLLICSYLEPDLVELVRQAHPGVDVVDPPDLLPAPRYPCDHGGVRPELDAAGSARWEQLLSRAEICFDFDWQDPAALPQRAPRLRWVQATSAGIGGFVERLGLERSDIAFTTAAGVHAVPLAEFVLTGVLHFVKEVPSLQQRQRDHVWQRYAAGSLAGRRALVVGLGSIGRRVVETLSGLGVEVWGAGRPGGCYDIPGLTRTGSTDDLGSLLPECTIVVLCVPLTASTNGLIGAAELAAMPEDTVLVNIARGDVVVEDALVERLRTGRLRGAALDVARTEPLPADSPLWDLDTVLISPHSASTMVTENATLTELFIDNLGRYLRGEPLRNRYRADAGY